MPRTIAIRKYSVILILMAGFCLLPNGGYAAQRHTLILTLEDTGSHLRVIELLSTGEIITTGQDFIIGNFDDEQIGVSPDSRFVWTGATTGTGNRGVQQFSISSYGQLSSTSRFIETGMVDNIKFTPNGQMLLLGSSCPIYRVYPDGSVESTANIYGTGGHISPRGDIDLVLANPVYVEKIDYSGFSVYNIQAVIVDGGGATPYDAVYTPEGDYVAITKGGGSSSDLVIYPILTNGSLDTSNIQRFDVSSNSNTVSLAISQDGQYIYFSIWDTLKIGILKRVYTSSGPYEDTGIRVPVIYRPWQMIVSPDGKYLVWYGYEYVDDGILGCFAIQDDGNLIPVYQFPFAATFGHNPIYFQFAYPEAATEIDSLNWQLYQ